MKKLLTTIATAVFVVFASLCFASYVIHLKSGHSFQTDRYWEEGGEIKFKRYGGVIGIQKDLVREIEVIEEVEELPAEKEKAEPTKEDVSQAAKKQGAEAEGKVKAGKQEVPEKVAKEQGAERAKEQEKPEEASEEQKKKAEQEKAAKMQAFLEEKREIMRESEAATSAFREAKARKDKKGAKEQFRKIVSLREKLRQLDKKVKTAYGGQLPEWWTNPE